jgi:hypothetical protein
VAIVLALVTRVWLVSSRSVRTRLLAIVAVVVGFALAVDLPILLGWVVFGRTWLAEEIGVIMVAVGALVLGVRWMGAKALAQRA